MPKMKHSGITMSVPESRVADREAQGWVVVDDAPAEDKPAKRSRKTPVDDAPAEEGQVE
jgi:hypothetical protein